MNLQDLKNKERKLYKKYAAFIVLGILLIASAWKWNSVWANVLVISGGLIIIISLQIFSTVFADFYKLKGKLNELETGKIFKESYIEWPQWLKKYGWLLYFIAILPGYYFAQKHENDFGGNKFVWHSVIAGIFLGLLAFSLLKFKFTDWDTDKNKKGEIIFYLILSAVVVCVSAGPVINIYFAKEDAVCNTYQLIRKGKNYKTGTKYIHVKIGSKTERFNPPNPLYKMISNNDSLIILCVKKGFIGYEYVAEFKLVR